MEELLDAADALVAAYPDGDPPCPDFDMPADYNPAAPNHFIELREEGAKKGKGWFSKMLIPAGTVLTIDKPLAMVMNWQQQEEDDENDNEEDIYDDEGEDEMEEDEVEHFSTLNELLLLELLRKVKQNPHLWANTISNLYPRDNETAATLPAWVCQDDALSVEVEKSLEELRTVQELDEKSFQDIKYRLPLIIRYNGLSIETCPELLVHPGPGGHSSLGGTGLYYTPSFFNHNCRPNVSRYAVGDVMWFVANQDINADEEMFISYLEHDVLCEGPDRRTNMLQMDFQDGEQMHIEDGEEDDGPDFPVVDDLVQSELMSMDPIERLDAIRELFEQAMGEKNPEEQPDLADIKEEEVAEVEGEIEGIATGTAAWFQCDIQNLRILRAITLDGQGKPDEALKEWEACVHFSETKLPPVDENSVAMRVQVALCARCAGKIDIALNHAAVALRLHNALFGGGIKLFRRRYYRELQLALRPDNGSFEAGGFAALDELWQSN